MADVADTLAEWSSTTASNAPDGTASIGTGLDDNLREIQGVITRGLSHKGADIASAGTTDIGAIEGLMHDITGTTTITGLGTVRAGIWKILKFEGAATVTHNATSLILPAATNIVAADGDVGIFVSEGSGNWRCVSFQRAAGLPVRNIALGTEQASTSGTAIDFTGIPSGVRRVKVMFVGVSTNGSDEYLVQLGDSGGVESSGYTSTCILLGASPTTDSSTAGFIATDAVAAGNTLHGVITLCLEDASDFTWVSEGKLLNGTTSIHVSVGSKSLSAELDRIRITTTGGTNTFDAGAINISYER